MWMKRDETEADVRAKITVTGCKNNMQNNKLAAMSLLKLHDKIMMMETTRSILECNWKLYIEAV